jgi:hypothetical protein
MPASRYRSLSPITEERRMKRHKSDRHFSMKGIRACMRCYSNNWCWREVIVRLIRADQLCRLHATHNRQRIIHLRRVGYSNRLTSGRQEKRLAIRTSRMSKRPFSPHARFERVHRKRPVLHNLDCVPVLQEDLDDHLLVHEVVFSEQDIKLHVVRWRYGTESSRLESRDEYRCEILGAQGRRYPGMYTVVVTPLH